MRSLGITLISLALTCIVIGNAYYQKKQFYPSVVYITKSNPSMAVIYVQAFILVILMGKLMRKVFFGQLRAAEFEHLVERSWYAVTETCLAFTMFRDDFSPKFVALFTLLLFLKSFHWLAEDRVDFMERSPIISWLFHIRVLLLLLILGSLDMYFVGHAYQSTLTKGASVQLVFGFEYAILLMIIVNICIKYILHTIDMNSENPWESKAVFLLYTELVMGFFKVILYITFVAIMIRIYTLPLFAFRPMYYTMRAFKKAFNDVILSRRAIRNMNTLYPDATQEELAAADNVCIICREEMTAASKKLPCNHIFHTSCLRSWFQRQQTCPTCRLNILRTTPAIPAQQPAPPPAAAPPPMPPGGMNLPQFPMWQMFQPQQRPDNQAPQGSGNLPGSAPSSSQANSSGNGGASANQMPSQVPPGGLPFMCPPFPFMPFIPPPPMPPPNFSGLSMEELLRMEGNTRENIEARLQCLRNIQLLLDASVTMMQQYASVVARIDQVPTTPRKKSEKNPAAASVPSNNEGETISAEKPTVIVNGNNVISETSTSSVAPAPSTSGNSTNSKDQEEVRRKRLQKFAQAAD